MEYYIDNTKKNTKEDGTKDNPFITFASALRTIKTSATKTTVWVNGVFNEVVKWNIDNTEVKALTPETVIDGKYLLPTGTTRIGAEKLEGNDKSLVLITGNNILWSIKVNNSRGRGLQVGNNANNSFNNVIIDDIFVQGCRTAAIDARNGTNLTISKSSIFDTSNYNTKVRDSAKYNYAGSIKTLNVDGLFVFNNRIFNHYGNVLTPSRGTKNVIIRNNDIFDCWGSLIYLHYVNNCEVYENTIYYTPAWKQSKHAGVVINNEEEFVDEGGVPGNIIIRDNYILGTDNGIGIWGNEGANVITTNIEIFNNIIINTTDSAILIRDGKKVKNVNIHDNILSVDKSQTPIKVSGGYDELTFNKNGFTVKPIAEASSKEDFIVPQSSFTTVNSAQELLAEVNKLRKILEPVDPNLEVKAAIKTIITTFIENQTEAVTQLQTLIEEQIAKLK